GREDAARGSQRAGRRCLARPQQGSLRHPRDARTAKDWPDRKPPLDPKDQLGRAEAFGDGEARRQGGVPGLMERIVTRIGWIIVIAILVFALTIFAYNIGFRAGEGEITVAGQKEVVDPKGGPPVTVAEAVVVGPTGLVLPVVGVKPGNLVHTYTQ